MSKDIAKLQQQLFDLAFNNKEDNNEVLANIKNKAGISGSDRFDVNRQTIISGLISGLEIIFPKTWLLLGKKCATGVAKAYIEQINTLPKKLCLDHWAEDFPEFVANFSTTKSLVFIEDFVKLEYLCHLSEQVEPFTPLKMDDLEGIKVIDADKMYMQLNDTIFLMETVFPLQEIRKMAGKKLDDDFKITIKLHHIVVCRINNIVKIFWLNQDQFAFIKNIKAGDSVIQILKKVHDYDDSLEILPRLFNFIVEKDMLIKVY